MRIERFKSSPRVASRATAAWTPRSWRVGRSGLARTCAAAFIVVSVSGCATNDPRDPLEPFNRGMFELNEALDRGLIRPTAQVYATVVPVPARTGVSNFFGNIYDFWNAVNNLLQGKVEAALTDVTRIALNTTVGLLGVVDVASRVGLEKSDEDLGQTLGWWGIGHGPYLVLPLIGPSSVRDGTGTIVQIALDPQTRMIDDSATMWSLWGLRLIDNRANLLGASAILDQAASDRYGFVRDAYFQRRRNQLWDGRPPREDDFTSTAQPSVVQLPAIWLRPTEVEGPQPRKPETNDAGGSDKLTSIAIEPSLQASR